MHPKPRAHSSAGPFSFKITDTVGSLKTFSYITFNSRWSSKYGLVDFIMPIDGASTQVPKICHSLSCSGLIRSESSRSNCPWLESAVTPSDCLFLLHHRCTRLCQRCTCICVLPTNPPPKRRYPRLEKRGRELKTRFEDYFTEQLKLLLLHSFCCRSLRIADKPSFQCLIWNPTEMNCQFWFHAQVCFSPFKSCVPTNVHPAGIHKRKKRIKVLMFRTQVYFQIHPCVINWHRSEILHYTFMDVFLPP